MKKARGFTLIEILIVIFLIVFLVSIGGYSYAKLRKQADSLEYKNHADNISRLISSMYKTGIYGNNKKYASKGSYPSVKTMSEGLANEIINSYDSNIKINFVISDQNRTKQRPLIHQLYRNPFGENIPEDKQQQEWLKNNYDTIIYQPLHSHSSGKPNELCLGTDDSQDDCREAILYFITFEDNKYQIRESNRLRAGVEEK